MRTPRSPCVLIVEDHPLVALSLQDIVQEIGCEFVGPVATGEDAIKLAEQHCPDLILMDVELKGRVNGIDAATEIKRRFDIPSVFFSGHCDSETKRRAEQAEPLAFVDKSALLSNLADLLRSNLSIRPSQ